MTRRLKLRFLAFLLAPLCCFWIIANLINLSPGIYYRNEAYLDGICDSEPTKYSNFSKSILCSFTVLSTNFSELLVVSFSEFLKISRHEDCFLNETKPEIALVVPDRLYPRLVDTLSTEALFVLTSLLMKYDWLQTVSGAALVLNASEKPACTMNQKRWTIDLSEEYSEFDDGSKSISIRRCDHGRSAGSDLICYPCDLLPDVFLIKTASIGFGDCDVAVNTTTLINLKESARFPLFMELKGRSAYCPSVKVTGTDSTTGLDVACNNLRMVWDGNFVLLPPTIGVYRLISRDSDGQSLEHWLGCTWAQEAYEAESPAHCSNWVRQFLFDTVDILEKQMHLDYRLVYGSLLGAVRSGDVIPWSVDGDIAVETSSPDNFRRKTWVQLGELSQWRYSNLDRRGDDHFAPLRVFPSCPVRLTSLPKPSSIDDYNRSRQIGRILRQSRKVEALFSYSHWRSTGYVDVYDVRELLPCEKRYWKKAPFENVLIAGRRFKTVPNQIDQLQCQYGRTTWNKTPPSVAKGWKSFTDEYTSEIRPWIL